MRVNFSYLGSINAISHTNCVQLAVQRLHFARCFISTTAGFFICLQNKIGICPVDMIPLNYVSDDDDDQDDKMWTM
jgi:hypothetical protein